MAVCHVLVVAPGRSVRGGITSVVRTHSTLPHWTSWSCTWIETLGDDGPLGKILAAMRGLVSLLRRLPSARIVHIHVAWKNSALRKAPFFLFATLARKRTILHWHAPDLDEASTGFRGRVLGFMLRHADRVVVLSDYWRQAAVVRMRVDARRVHVVPNPVRLHMATRTPAAARILFVGNLDERKGVPTLIQAFRLIRAQHPDAELRLAGGGTRFLKRFSSDEMVGVTPLGWLSRDALDRELLNATCMCLPSRGEGVPMAVLEAMAHGCPVVATSAGGLVDVMKHDVNGFVVAVDHVDELAASIIRMIEDSTARQRVAAIAATEVEKTHGTAYVDHCLNSLYVDLAATP